MTRYLINLIFLATILPSGLLHAQKGDDPLPPDLYLMQMEIRTFISQAKSISRSELPPDSKEREQALTDLVTVGERIADIYFRNATEPVREEMDKELSSKINVNRSIQSYFIFMGNGFVNRAKVFIERREKTERKIRFYATLGGVLLGAAGGGGYLYFQNAKGAGLALKDYLIATTAVIGGGALGMFGANPLIRTYVIPADLSIRSARDFMRKYPDGADFVKKLSPANDDLRDVEDMLKEMGMDS